MYKYKGFSIIPNVMIFSYNKLYLDSQFSLIEGAVSFPFSKTVKLLNLLKPKAWMNLEHHNFC